MTSSHPMGFAPLAHSDAERGAGYQHIGLKNCEQSTNPRKLEDFGEHARQI